MLNTESVEKVSFYCDQTKSGGRNKKSLPSSASDDSDDSLHARDG